MKKQKRPMTAPSLILSASKAKPKTPHPLFPERTVRTHEEAQEETVKGISLFTEIPL